MPQKLLLPTYQTSHTPDSTISITNSGAKCIKQFDSETQVKF